MKVFLIIMAVLVLLIILILSISAEFTIIFDNGWSTKIKVLFIEKDIKLTELLSFIVAPEKVGAEAAEEAKENKKKKKDDKKENNEDTDKKDGAEEAQKDGISETADDNNEADGKTEVTEVKEQPESENESKKEPEKKSKPNFIKKLLDEDGVVGLLLLVSNAVQTLNKAVTTLIKGLHIYSLYVKIIIGGGDAAAVAEKYGAICGWYYPLKGFILNEMKVDNYDDYLQADFIAPDSEYEFQLIGSLSVGLLVKSLLKAGKVFIVNYFKNR